MEAITSIQSLDAQIATLERRQEEKKDAITGEFKNFMESLKPINLIKSLFHSVKESPDLKADIVKGAIGLGTGFLTNKLLLGKINGPFKAILATILPAVMTKAAVDVPEKIKENGLSFLAKTLRSMKIQSSEDKTDEQHATAGAIL
jgi:hypothetical protein